MTNRGPDFRHKMAEATRIAETMPNRVSNLTRIVKRTHTYLLLKERIIGDQKAKDELFDIFLDSFHAIHTILTGIREEWHDKYTFFRDTFMDISPEFDGRAITQSIMTQWVNDLLNLP